METEATRVHAASILYVGLDVHKDSVDIATADVGREGEIRHIGQIGGDLAALDKALRRLISRAGIADHVWTIEEIVNLVAEPEAKKRGPYKSKA